MNNITKPDIEFIETALQESWYQWTQKLERKDLGDIEREQTLNLQRKAKVLIEKLQKPVMHSEQVDVVKEVVIKELNNYTETCNRSTIPSRSFRPLSTSIAIKIVDL